MGETYSEIVDQRSSETLYEKDMRMSGERIKLDNALSHIHVSHHEYFKQQAIIDYIKKEDKLRGLDSVPPLSMSDEQISAYAMVRHEALMIYANEFELSVEEFENEIAQEIAFTNTVDALKLPRINRSSDNFSRFGLEKGDYMVDKFCRSSESRAIILDNILEIRGGTESPTTDRAYHTMLRLVSAEWERWKKDNNITGDGTDGTNMDILLPSLRGPLLLTEN